MGKKKTGIWDIIIIGAGASGMMAAVTAARRGSSVLLLEHMDKPGKKLLATGNGKCNFTNEQMDSGCYHGDPVLIDRVLSAFSRDDCLCFFREIGIYPKNRRGYYYPNSEQAASVVEAFTAELLRCGVTLVTGAKLTAFAEDKYGFVCRAGDVTYRGRKVIAATGLLASPKLGSDGSALDFLKALGHRFVPILPALCGFYAKGMNFHKVSGVRWDADLTLDVAGESVARERGELQLTDYGVSGIPVFQLSALAARALYEKKAVCMHLNLLPDLTREALAAELSARLQRWKTNATAGQLLVGLLNQKLIAAVLTEAGIPPETPLAQVTDAVWTRLTACITDYQLPLVRVREMEYAQVCTGGIRTGEIVVDTLESKFVPGLYFAGELLDVDGICGGYNLQWAWASGFVAGMSASA